MSSTRLNIAANYLGQGWAALMAVAFLPSYVHHLGVEAYGLIGLFVVIQAMVMVLDMGTGPTLNREMVRFALGTTGPQYIRNLLRSMEIICFVFAVLFVLAVWAVSGYLSREWLQAGSLRPSEVALALVLMALAAGMRLCEGIYRGSLYGLEHQIWYNATFSVLSTLRYAGALGILIFVAPTLQAFFIWQAAISLLTIFILSSRVYRSLPKAILPGSFSMEALTSIRRFAAGMMGIAFLTMLFLQMDKLLLSRLVSLQDLGYYSLAATAANVMFMMVIPIAQAVYPRVVKLSAGDDKKVLAGLYHKTAQFVTVLTASASLLLCFFSEGVIYAWSGNPDLVKAIAPILSVLVLGSFLNGLSYLPSQVQIAHGSTGFLVKLNACSLLAFVPMLLVVVPVYGVRGAAWCWVALNASYLFWVAGSIHARIEDVRTRRSYHWVDMVLPTLAAGAVLLIAKYFAPHEYSSRLAWAFFLMCAGVMALTAAAFAAPLLRAHLLRLFKLRMK